MIPEKIIDFHTHTLFSDGALSVAEHIRRAQVAGYKTIGITDHVDFSNYREVFESVTKMTEEVKDCGWDIEAIAGIEITHVPASRIGKMVEEARAIGIKLIIVHGETIAEPVEAGTNRAAIEAGVTILAHPGLITLEEAELARDNGVFLEITGKKGHSLTNGHVLSIARKAHAEMILSSDGHIHTEFLSPAFAEKVLAGAGMIEAEQAKVYENLQTLANRLLGK